MSKIFTDEGGNKYEVTNPVGDSAAIMYIIKPVAKEKHSYKILMEGDAYTGYLAHGLKLTGSQAEAVAEAIEAFLGLLETPKMHGDYEEAMESFDKSHAAYDR